MIFTKRALNRIAFSLDQTAQHQYQCAKEAPTQDSQDFHRTNVEELDVLLVGIENELETVHDTVRQYTGKHTGWDGWDGNLIDVSDREATIQELEELTKHGYSYNAYTPSGWRAAIKLLRRFDLTDDEVILFMLSKHTRWAGDADDNRRYGKYNGNTVLEYLGTAGSNRGAALHTVINKLRGESS